MDRVKIFRMLPEPLNVANPMTLGREGRAQAGTQGPDETGTSPASSSRKGFSLSLQCSFHQTGLFGFLVCFFFSSLPRSHKTILLFQLC